MKLLTSELLLKMDEGGEEYRNQFVILDRHPDFVDQWFVNIFDEIKQIFVESILVKGLWGIVFD